MKHSELRHQPRHVNPRIQETGRGKTGKGAEKTVPLSEREQQLQETEEESSPVP